MTALGLSAALALNLAAAWALSRNAHRSATCGALAVLCLFLAAALLALLAVWMGR